MTMHDAYKLRIPDENFITLRKSGARLDDEYDSPATDEHCRTEFSRYESTEGY